MTGRFDEGHLQSLFADEHAPLSLEDRFRAAAASPGAITDPAPRGRPWLAPAVGAALAVLAVLGVASARQVLTGGDDQARPASSADVPQPGRASGANTGIPVGVGLSPHHGDLVVVRPGAVVEDKLVSGRIVVTVPDVTIRRTKVVPPAGADAAIRQDAGATNLTVEDVEIAAPVTGYVRCGICQQAAGLAVRRTNIHGVTVGVRLTERAEVTGSYLHDLSDRPEAAGVLASGGSLLTVTGSTLLAPPTGAAAVDLRTDGTGLSTVELHGNVLGGGGYAVRFGTGATSNIKVVDNRFSRAVSPGGGSDGPVHAWDTNAPANVWAGNVWDDTGELVEP